MGGQAGIAPADIDRSDLFGVLSMLGLHRHPDYWLTDYDLTPDWDAEPETTVTPRGPMARGARRGSVSSRRGRASTPGLQARDESKSLFAQRRAAARGEAPPPQAAPPSGGALGVAQLFGGGGVTGGH